MSDDWGCNVDLFGESSKSTAKSLTELVDSLTKKNMNGARPQPSTSQEPENQKIVVPVMKRSKIPMVHAPKILKKKKASSSSGSSGLNNNNVKNVLNEANPKRVHFDIEQFLSREGGSNTDRIAARERMLTSLGAAPSKGTYVNYKELKTERAAKKAEARAAAEMNHGNSLLMAQIKKKKNNNKRK